MPQGLAKQTKNEYKKNKEPRVKKSQKQPKKYKKRKDPLKAAMIQRAEAISMMKAQKDPRNGKMKLIKPDEKQMEKATRSAKEVMKKATQK